MTDAGFSTATEAWSRHKKLFSLSTITSALNGHRDISRQAAGKFGAAFNVDPGWILYGGDGAPRSALAGAELGEVLLRIAALPDQQARQLFEALSERFEASTHSELPSGDLATTGATTPTRQRKRS
jgi:hypothetical protein